MPRYGEYWIKCSDSTGNLALDCAELQCQRVDDFEARRMNAKNVNDPSSRRGGGQPPRSDKPNAAHSKDTKLGEAYDWREPWLNTLKFCNILSAHAAGVVVIAAFAELLEIIITSMSQTPLVWTVSGIKITLSDIVHFGDLFVVIAFFSVALFDIYKWVRSR